MEVTRSQSSTRKYDVLVAALLLQLLTASPPAADAALQPGTPKIWLYPLPSAYTNCSRPNWESYNYGAEALTPRMIRESPYFTDNPEEADFFYVHAYFYCSEAYDNAKMNLNERVLHVLDIIKRDWPYWERSNGANHLWTWVHDLGYCGTSNADMADTLPEIANGIMLTHFGLTTTIMKSPGCPVVERVLMRGVRCPHPATFQTSQPCFRPERDIVMPFPCLEDGMWLKAHRMAAEGREKKYMLQFRGAGRLENHDVFYSHGVRQQLFMLGYGDKPGYIYSEEKVSFDDMAREMAQSEFCLAASGVGWGVRFKHAIMSRCIPVIISDHLQYEYESILPYEKFSVRIHQYMVHELDYILTSLVQDHKDKLLEMRRNLNCVWRYFVWRGEEGRAMEVFMCHLRRVLDPRVTPYLDFNTCTLHCSSSAQMVSLKQLQAVSSLLTISQALNKSRMDVHPIEFLLSDQHEFPLSCEEAWLTVGITNETLAVVKEGHERRCGALPIYAINIPYEPLVKQVPRRRARDPIPARNARALRRERAQDQTALIGSQSRPRRRRRRSRDRAALPERMTIAADSDVSVIRRRMLQEGGEPQETQEVAVAVAATVEHARGQPRESVPRVVEMIRGFNPHKEPAFSFIYVNTTSFRQTTELLKYLEKYVAPGCVFVFEALVNYDGYHRGPLKAFRSWLVKRQTGVHVVGMLAPPEQQDAMLIRPISRAPFAPDHAAAFMVS